MWKFKHHKLEPYKPRILSEAICNERFICIFGPLQKPVLDFGSFHLNPNTKAHNFKNFGFGSAIVCPLYQSSLLKCNVSKIANCTYKAKAVVLKKGQWSWVKTPSVKVRYPLERPLLSECNHFQKVHPHGDRFSVHWFWLVTRTMYSRHPSCPSNNLPNLRISVEWKRVPVSTPNFYLEWF